MNKRNLVSSLVMFFAPIVLLGQAVVGTVTAEGGKPLAGANIVVVGTELGTSTDDMGSYQLPLLGIHHRLKQSWWVKTMYPSTSY